MQLLHQQATISYVSSVVPFRVPALIYHGYSPSLSIYYLLVLQKLTIDLLSCLFCGDKNGTQGFE